MVTGLRKILVLDFDGVIHSYKSGWVQPDFIPDPPVPGAFDSIYRALQDFDVQIFSSRSHQEGGIRAMRVWIEYWARKELDNEEPNYRANAVINGVAWRKEAFPIEKPSAFVSIDDRAIQFDGFWPALEILKNFKPWNKK